MNQLIFADRLGIDATKGLPGEGFKRPGLPLIKMDEAVKAKVEQILGGQPSGKAPKANATKF